MVRNHYDKYDDNSHKAVNCRSVAASGISLLGAPRCLERFRETTHARHPCLSTERQVCLYSRHIRVVHARRFAKPAFALCAFRRQQMASRRTRPQNLATCGDLEALRHRFARFAACNGLRHRATNIVAVAGITNSFTSLRRPTKGPNPKDHVANKLQSSSVEIG